MMNVVFFLVIQTSQKRADAGSLTVQSGRFAAVKGEVKQEVIERRQPFESINSSFKRSFLSINV